MTWTRGLLYVILIGACWFCGCSSKPPELPWQEQWKSADADGRRLIELELEQERANGYMILFFISIFVYGLGDRK
jgi:hypothetical protein